MKIVAAIIAAALLAVYVGPVIVKLKDIPLSIVVCIGYALMLADLVQSLRAKD
jgi:hypothetical protein